MMEDKTLDPVQYLRRLADRMEQDGIVYEIIQSLRKIAKYLDEMEQCVKDRDRQFIALCEIAERNEKIARDVIDDFRNYLLKQEELRYVSGTREEV
jgi:hypothetical protein